MFLQMCARLPMSTESGRFTDPFSLFYFWFDGDQQHHKDSLSSTYWILLLKWRGDLYFSPLGALYRSLAATGGFFTGSIPASFIAGARPGPNHVARRVGRDYSCRQQPRRKHRGVHLGGVVGQHASALEQARGHVAPFSR